jgi:hypothetical protein
MLASRIEGQPYVQPNRAIAVADEATATRAARGDRHGWRSGSRGESPATDDEARALGASPNARLLNWGARLVLS